jgi:putative ATP-binding cassette transporter
MKLLRFLLRDEKMVLAIAVFVGLLSGTTSAMLMALISTRLMSAEPLTMSFVGYFIGLVLVVVLLDFVAKWLLIRLGTRTSINFQIDLCWKILLMPFEKKEKIGGPRLLATLSEDVITVATAFNQISTVCVSIATIVGCLLYLAWLSPIALLALLPFALPGVFGHKLLHQKGQLFLRQALEVRDVRFEQFKALTEGTKELKLHSERRRMFWVEQLSTTAAALQNKIILSRTWHEGAATWSQTLYFLFICVLFVLAAIQKTNFQILTGYALIALYMRASVNSLLSAIPIWSRADEALKKIESLGFSLESLPRTWPTPTAPNSHIHLELTGITHTYTRDFDDSRFTLGPIDLKLTSGELIFFTGGNGSGKTTLIKVLTTLYRPEAGQICLNGRLLTDETLESYRQNFSVIFSDFYLFEQLLGLEESHLDTKAHNYLVKLQLEHKVSIKNGILSTTKLSTGQRKRLGLLTAYLEDRPIYIFDEWAASQDPMFKEVFYRQLLPELKARGKLIIVISHDDHYYDVADRIIKLNYGKIEEDKWIK